MVTRYLIGITGASGAVYGVRLVQALLADPDREVHLIVSPAGARVMAAELPPTPSQSKISNPQSALRTSDFFDLTPAQSARLFVYDYDDIGAAPASGTFRAAAMVICPCSMKTLGHVAAGLADSLLARAADVALKEGRPLLLVPRETPLSLIHLRNMTSLAEAGAVILPAMPAFYHHPQTIDDLVRHLVQKILDRLGLDSPDAIRWSGR